MKKAGDDFRAVFGRMADEAVIDRSELATLLATTPGAVTQMVYRDELPPTAFPGKRRSCWFVGDIRRWLAETAHNRGVGRNARPDGSVRANKPPSAHMPRKARIGRPRAGNANE